MSFLKIRRAKSRPAARIESWAAFFTRLEISDPRRFQRQFRDRPNTWGDHSERMPKRKEKSAPQSLPVDTRPRPAAIAAGIPVWASELANAPLVSGKASLQKGSALVKGGRPSAPKLQDHPALMTVAECAINLGVSEKTIRRLITAGKLRSVRIGRAVRISVRQICDFIGDGR